MKKFTEKQKVLTDAPGALNKPDQPWEATVEGDSIVARWKWMDATFFALTEITNEVKEYTFTVKLDDKGKYKELDRAEESSASARMSGGKLGFGGSSSTFMGKTGRKSIQFGLGKNNQTGEIGIVGFQFDTGTVKKPIRDYMAANGWESAGTGMGAAGMNKKIKAAFRIIYVISLLIAGFVFTGFLQDMQFASKDLHRWSDAAATVTESKMTGETMGTAQKKRPGSNVRITVKQYTVRYAYAAEFNAWGKLFRFEHEGGNSGETDQNATQIPASAYNFPKQSYIVSVIFDPEAEGSYRVGSKAEWQSRGEVSFANPSLIVSGVFFVVAVLLIAVDVVTSGKRRAA